MWTLFEIFINFVQAILILVFMKGRLHITRKHKLSDIFCVTCITLYTTAYLIWNIPLSDACVFIIPLIYALYIADDPWYVSAFWTSILTLLFLSVISLSLHIFMTIPHISYEKLMEISIGRLLFVLVTNIMLALVVFLISKMKKDYSAPYWPVLLLFLATNMALFMVEEALYALQMSVELHGMVSTHTLFFAYIGLCACTVLTIFLFHIMSQSVERENQYRAEAFTVAHTKQYQQELEQLYTRLRTAKHDMKQHYQVLEEMVSQGNNAEAKEYFVTCQQNAEKDDFYLTGSTAVDALLLAKSLTMKKSGILFRYSPYPLDQIPINEPDFCTIIGNLLDNAIEGSLRMTPTDNPLTIQLAFSRSWDMFYIYCTNSCNEQTIHYEKGIWRSSKEVEGMPEFHAIGIRSIEHIADTANGRCSFNVEDGTFYAKVVLPYEKTESKGKHNPCHG